MTKKSNGKYTRNHPMIDGTPEAYEAMLDKLDAENAELKLSQGRLECRVIETQEFGLAEIKKLKDEKDSFEKNFDYVVENLNTAIDKLKDENSFLTDKVDSLHRVVDNRDRFIHKIQNENKQLEDDKIDSELRIDKLVDDVEGLEKERDNAFRVLNLRDERIKQLETRELELAEKIDSRNLPPQDSITDKPRHIKNLGIDRDGNVVVFTHHLDKVRK